MQTKKRPVPGGAGQASNLVKFTENYTPSTQLLSRLDKVRETGSDKWIACCPAHPDKNPSLSVRECPDGTLLVKCWAGCTASEITSAVGLELRHLFPPKPYQHIPRKDGLTYAQRRKYIALLREESYLIKFAQGVMACNGEITPDDAERVLLADQRVRKLRGLLNV